ncbi:acyl-CoA dehydrogenase family protein [Amycolatopsis sp. A133]|uniref:acyl-CoA dehydrogenase family protein n=1 Tax=Amycolatopsis sp. A133 TaxID=3064472 RepID=UPI0027F44998|nr:acyl-CoA dehydrogenase family protein [Amycolatopsis sp. A133]MDQ7806745.1 acyl-CoA dehydrogenase family protein [Amycolatopsis sp. A133]
MTTVTSVSTEDFPPPPEPDLTPAQVVARAEAIAASLVERQAETEKRTYYAEDTHEQFREAGFYRILVPRRYGGYEFGVETFMRVAMAIARGCPSTGWGYLFGAAHALPVASLFGREAQDEVFAGGDFICPITVGPTGSGVRTEDGSWLVNGNWGYSSGAPYATHFVGHTLVSGEDGPRPLMFLLPRAQWQRLDDWGNGLGLKGSGSHTIRVENVVVPPHRVLEAHVSQLPVTEGTPGRELHGNPEYGGGPLSFMLLELGVLSVGIAQGALDAYADLMRTRTTTYLPIVPRAEDTDYQFHYGEAVSKIGAAEAAVLGALRQWSETCARGAAAFTRETELRLALISKQAIALTWSAVSDHLFPTAGSSAVKAGERIERVWRDLSMLHSHAGVGLFLGGKAGRELARLTFGVPE